MLVSQELDTLSDLFRRQVESLKHETLPEEKKSALIEAFSQTAQLMLDIRDMLYPGNKGTNSR